MLRKIMTFLSLLGLLLGAGCDSSLRIEVEGCPEEDAVVFVGTSVNFVITVHPAWINDVSMETRVEGAAVVDGFDTQEPAVRPVAPGDVLVTFTALTRNGVMANESCAFSGFVCGCGPGDEGCNDGLFCTGREFCPADCSGCVAPGNPCGANEYCNEKIDECEQLCEIEVDCDDGDVCTTGACGDEDEDGVRTCSYTPINCDDDDLCTEDSCDATGENGDPDTGCVNTPVACADGEICVEGICVRTCASNVDCDDGDPCIDDSCVDGVCVNAAKDCDDGMFCNGAETCDQDTGECLPGTPPCEHPLGPQCLALCDEFLDNCPMLSSCTADSDCDDGLFCSGVETCDEECGSCELGEPPCEPIEVCDEAIDACLLPVP